MSKTTYTMFTAHKHIINVTEIILAIVKSRINVELIFYYIV